MKNVQIPYELFFQLMKYHLMEDESCEVDIRRGLEKKLDALVMHELYTKSKMAVTEEEREKCQKRISGQTRRAGKFSMVILF